MTTDEAKSIYNRLFTAFPHLKAYLDNTDNPQATFDAWKRMLSHSRLDDAENALDKIFGGSCEVPTKPWDMGTLAVWLRSVIGRVADDRAKLERQAARDEHIREAKQVKQGKRLNFGQAWRIAVASGACKRRGEITKERNREIMEYVFTMQSHHESEPMEVPSDIRHEYENPSSIFKKEVFS
jgi:hypothetical protein